MIKPAFLLLDRLGARPEFLGFSEDASMLWEVMATEVDTLTTASGLNEMFGVAPTTFVSRLNRDGLPSAKDLLSAIRLLRAGQLYGSTVQPVADSLHFASPQSFNRHVRARLGLTGKQYLEAFDWTTAFDRFVGTFYTPHREMWREWKAVRRPSQLKEAA